MWQRRVVSLLASLLQASKIVQDTDHVAVPAVEPPQPEPGQPNNEANQLHGGDNHPKPAEEEQPKNEANQPNGAENQPKPGEGEQPKPAVPEQPKDEVIVPNAGVNKPNGGADKPNEEVNQPKPGEEGQPKPDAVAAAPAAPAAPKAAAPGVRTLSIKVTDSSKAASQPHALPAPNEALAKLLDSISTSSLTKGNLPTFTDRALASLTTNYATNPGSGAFTEPADITEKQWDSIFKHNRALHGYWYDWDLNILVKASKKGRVGLVWDISWFDVVIMG